MVTITTHNTTTKLFTQVSINFLHFVTIIIENENIHSSLHNNPLQS